MMEIRNTWEVPANFLNSPEMISSPLHDSIFHRLKTHIKPVIQWLGEWLGAIAI
jgi:hypothetical protein